MKTPNTPIVYGMPHRRKIKRDIRPNKNLENMTTKTALITGITGQDGFLY
ncbi:hypothetical protein KC799_13320 [candidate division KSB1 bacterium]|nr:hypothetical protein [candidate division KSB1 bacterium]